MEFKRTTAADGKPGARPVNNVWQDVNEYVVHWFATNPKIPALVKSESLLVEMLDARFGKKYNAEMVVKLLRNGFYDAKLKIFIFKRIDFECHRPPEKQRAAGKELVLEEEKEVTP